MRMIVVSVAGAATASRACRGGADAAPANPHRPRRRRRAAALTTPMEDGAQLGDDYFLAIPAAHGVLAEAREAVAALKLEEIGKTSGNPDVEATSRRRPTSAIAAQGHLAAARARRSLRRQRARSRGRQAVVWDRRRPARTEDAGAQSCSSWSTR